MLYQKCLFLVFAISTILLHCSFSQPKNTGAQNIFDYLQSQVDGNQIIFIRQDSSVNRLIYKHIRIKQLNPGLDGYRIQIFSGTGKEAREKISQVRSEFLTVMPGFDATRIYPVYQPPFFKIRVGDYRSKAEAFPVYKQIVKKFPSAYIVKEKINPPKLE